MANLNDTPDLPAHVVAEQTHLQLPSFPHWIEAAVEYLRRKAVLSGACQEARSGKLMVALHEALSNAIVHGNLELPSDLKDRGENAFAEALSQRIADPHLSGRVVEVLVDCNLERCRWTVTDQGQGFDVERLLNENSSAEPEAILASGRGILIMRSFLDEVSYEMGGRRLILTLRRESGREKRLHPRVPLNQPLHVAPVRPDGTVDWDAAYKAVAKDFSAEGISILQERLARTDHILLGISINNRLVYVPAEVRHCRSLGTDVVELGCRFQQPVGEAPLNAEDESQEMIEVHQAVNHLLATHQVPPLKVGDRRLHQRIVYNERVRIISGASSDPIVGFAHDLSRGGIAFITTVPLSLEITIQFPQPDGTSLRLRSRVVRCNKIMDGFYDVGACFLQMEERS